MFDQKIFGNANNFPPGRYRNRDCFRHQGLFLKKNGSDLFLQKFRDFSPGTSRNNSFYFRPSYLPVVDLDDYTQGSCWRDWIMPTASFEFVVTHDEISVEEISRDLSITQYVEFVYHQIAANIQEIYQTNSTVCFHYSGGVDALVVLSFLIKFKLLPRTNIVYWRNLTQEAETGLSFRDHDLRKAIGEVFEICKKSAAAISVTDITVNDVIDVINHRGYFDLANYASSIMMHRYPGYAHMDGYLGNATLLHRYYYSNMLVKNTQNYESFYQAWNHPKRYMNPYQLPDDMDNILPISRSYLGVKLFHGMDQSQIRIYNPLGNDCILEKLRSLKCDDYSHEDIITAKFARDIIQRNDAGYLDHYVLRTTESEGSNLKHMKFAWNRIDPNVTNLTWHNGHDALGRQWLEYEIDIAKKTNSVSINTVVSIKAQQQIESLIHAT